MARPETAKTPLAARLREVRRAVGDISRASFADQLSISEKTLGNYERGDNEPTASVLAAYQSVMGTNLHWIITGQGNMFEPDRSPAHKLPIIEPLLMRKLGELVDMTFREERGRIRDLDLVVETGNAYNDLRSLVDDLTDTEAIEEALPLVKRRLKKRLADTANNPANRKHSA
ncbi:MULTISPECIES: helix-turn-helix domain-containing protein [unclassified Brucella]|uniref:helix-turn-helix domain-containing protein n=1 Tax=unclassified Brucella TaxID=2632610 RepID=UPI00046D3389|nr:MULTISPECIES: transcriptional regulator [unclassified Brucella]QPN28832.1 helix-turn-helix transcriptional regulator [Brucella sp. BO2]UWF60992.1 helix-turn-helix domain-containing protein [Brucella sp. 2716]